MSKEKTINFELTKDEAKWWYNKLIAEESTQLALKVRSGEENLQVLQKIQQKLEESD